MAKDNIMDISVVILTYNEELHIQRCIERVLPISKEIFVVDCFSTDQTKTIASRLGANVFERAWPGNQATQFNWALENLPIRTKWVLRLDADEYLCPELIEEIRVKLDTVSPDVTGVLFNLRRIFMGRHIRHGMPRIKLLRLFCYGKARCERRLMDEHIQLSEGYPLEFEHDFADHNLNTIGWWTQKHKEYAIRETIEMLSMELGDFTKTEPHCQGKLSGQALEKRRKKWKYVKAPLFLRSFTYFLYRYVGHLGFLDGKEGFLWHFLQGWWYRTLVDAMLFEIKTTCGADKSQIVAYVKDKYGLDFV